jgi:hypothetical protein
MFPALHRLLPPVATLLAAALLAGCEALAVTAMGVGASAGVTHTASSINERTFTLPAAKVRAASLTALERMNVVVDAIDQLDDGRETIKGQAAGRRIEVEIEPMGPTTTQLRATAKRNLFVHDAATAREIVTQTEQVLAAAPPPAVVPRRVRAAPAAPAAPVATAPRKLAEAPAR